MQGVPLMDDNRDITSTNFDYDAYSGGSDNSVTSSSFDYDVYSGKNAMEYLKKQNEAEAEKKRQANKTAAELKREAYEKKFAGMSADELFGMPEKKKEPEEDFSDFFDADEIERQQQKIREFEQEKHTVPKLESMMPGDDSQSSAAPESHTVDALEKVNIMMSHARFQREREDQIYRNLGRTRYHRSRSTGAFFQLLFSSMDLSDSAEYRAQAIITYIMGFIIAGAGYGTYCRITHREIGAMLLIWGALGGAIAGIIRRISEEETFIEAIKHSIIEFVLLGVAGLIWLAAAFV